MTNDQAVLGTASRIAAGVSDQELLDRFVTARDDSAFASLVERHGGIVWRLCRRVARNEHDAEDAFQAVFVVLARKASSIRSGTAVGSWLYSTAYRIAVKARTTSQRQRELAPRPAEVARENPPWGDAALRELQMILDEEVDRLTEKLRAPFVLCCLEGMSRSEAARELGWPEETVKARLAQARKLLQTQLVRRGITLSAVLTAAALSQGAASAAPAVLAVAAQGSSASPSALALAQSFLSGMGGAAKLKAVALAAFLLVAVAATGAGLAAFLLDKDGRAPQARAAVAGVGDPEMFLAPPIPVFKAHDEQVLAVAISPDGKRLVTAGARPSLPGQYMLWDVETRKELVRLRGLRGIRSVVFSPDGKTVACGTFGGTIHLRDADSGRERAVFDAHKPPGNALAGVNAVAYSPDGELLASAGLDGVVKLWDARSLAEKKSFLGHTNMVFSVAMFRHGKALVSGGQDGTARIWDIGSGKERFTLQGHAGIVEMVAVSPDDRVVATASWDQTIKLWDAETGKLVATLPGAEGSVLGIAYSRDGRLLAGASASGTTRIWDLASRKTIQRLERHESAIWGVAFTPDGKILATGSSDRTAKLWNVETGKEIATLATAELHPVRGGAYAPDGKSLALAGNARFIQVRDASSGDVRLTLAGHTGIVNCVAISPDGKTLASGSSDRSIKLWNLATGKEERTLTGHTGDVLALAFARDGRLASAGSDRIVRCWDLAGDKGPTSLEGHTDAVRALAYSPDGATLASGGGDRVIHIWTHGKEVGPRRLTGHRAGIRALAFSPYGLLASAGDDGAVKVWEVGRDRERHTLGGHAGPALALAFTPGGDTLVSGGADQHAVVWDPTTGKRRGTLQGHKGAVTTVLLHPRGDHLITGSEDSTLLRWAGAASATPARVLKANPQGVRFARYSPGNDRLATGGAGGTVTLWSRSLVPARLPYPAIDGVFRDADFAPDGTALAVARAENVHILDVATGLIRRTLPLGKPVRSVKFSPDRKYLAATTGSTRTPNDPNEAWLFDVANGKEVARLEGHKGVVLRAAFSPDGKTLATSAGDRTTKLWDLPSGKLRGTLNSKSAFAKGLLFLPDGTLVTSGWDRAIRFWDVQTQRETKKWTLDVNLTTLAASADGSLLAAAEHPSPGAGPARIRVWQVATGKVLLEPKGHRTRVLGLAFTPDGRGLVASGGTLNTLGEITHWNLPTGEIRGTHTAPNQWMETVAVSPEGGRVVSTSSSSLRFWDLDFLHADRTWAAHDGLASCGVFANGGARLVTAGGDGSIKVWDVQDSRLVATLGRHMKPVHALALLPDGKTLASAGEDSTVKLWDLAAAREAGSLDGHTRSVYSLAPSPDGKTLASGGGDTGTPGLAELFLWDLETRKPRRPFDLERAVRSLAYSPDGTSLAASVAGGPVWVWSTGDHALRTRLDVVSPGPVAFSPDGKLLAAGDSPSNTEPGTSRVRVWDTETWKERSTLEKHARSVTDVAFSPDGRGIASASQDGTVKLHPIPGERTPSVADAGGKAPGTNDPALQPRPKAPPEYHVSFHGRPDNLPQMKLVGQNAENHVRFEPTGLRITLPAGYEGSRPQVGLSTGIVLQGDFEITVDFEILGFPKPEAAGSDTPMSLWLWRVNGDRGVTGVSRRVVVEDGHQFCAFAASLDALGKTTHTMGQTIPTTARTGRLRLVRIGPQMSYHTAEGASADFTTINQFTVGDQDMDDIRLIASTCDPKGALDVRFSNLRVRMGAIPPPSADPAIPAISGKQGGGMYLKIVAVVGCVFATLVGLTLFLRRRHCGPTAPPDAPEVREPAPPASPVAFSCSCGKRLRAKANLAGKKLPCPGCGKPVLVPPGQDDEPTITPS